MIEQYGNNIDKKISNPPVLRSRDCFCLWSDLLGFSNMFTETNWELTDRDKHKLYNRLLNAHSAVLHFSSTDEKTLILNDGIAKVFHPRGKDDINNILSISMYLRSCVEIHMAVNQVEKECGYPGCRTVMAYGENIEYIVDEVRFDDYVFNYTKPKGSDISDLARRIGNPVVVYNPREMQMNTAFSKAYITEEAGSRYGITGNNFYVDISVINAISRYSIDKGYKPMWFIKEHTLVYIVPYEENNTDEVILGFVFDKDIIRTQGLKYQSEVYRLLEYYPWDEKTSDFSFNLNDPLKTYHKRN